MRKHSLETAGCLRIGRTVAVMGVILWAPFAGTADAQMGETTLHIVHNPRPVLQASMELARRYGYVITYEDPKYAYQGDLKDVTQERRDLSRYPFGKAPKTYELSGGALALTIPNAAQVDESTMYGLLEEAVQSWTNGGKGGGHFQVQRQDGIFHVVPTEVRDRNGDWQPTHSILDTPITFITQSRDDWQTYKAIGAAVSAVMGIKVITLINGGIVLGGAADRNQYVLGAQDEPAAVVLMRAFNAMKRRRTWYLLYEPTLRAYVLNIEDVSGTSDVPGTQVASRRSARSPRVPASTPSGKNSGVQRPKCIASAVTPPCGA